MLSAPREIASACAINHATMQIAGMRPTRLFPIPMLQLYTAIPLGVKPDGKNIKEQVQAITGFDIS